MKAPDQGDSPSEPIDPAGLVATLLALALLAGLIEVAAIGLRKILTGHFVWNGPRVAWMAPLGYLLLATIPGALLAVVARRFRGYSRHCLAAGVFGLSLIAIVALIQLLTLQRLHPAALTLLAAGPAVQAARYVLLHPVQSVRVGRRAFVFLAALVVVLTAGVEGVQSRRAGAVEGSATGPNILLLVLDTVRALNLGLYGYPLPTTPRLEEYARSGVVFENAFATAPWTLPSHGSMLTGRFPHELGADWEKPIAEGSRTVAEVLGGRGFRTAAFVANLYYTTRETGLARGFQTWEDYPLSLKQILYSTEAVQLVKRTGIRIILRRHARIEAREISRRYLDWEWEHRDRPHFAFLNYFDAHIPYQAPPELVPRFMGDSGANQRARYDAAIAGLDAEIGRLLDTLRARGTLDRTVVIVTSDHGEQFGGHGLYDHGNSLYHNVLRVPLLVLLPDSAGAGRRIVQPVSLRSLAATMVELGGAEGRLPGRSLARFWTSAEPGLEEQDSPVLSELTPSPRVPREHRNARGELRSLVRGQWHYIVNGDDSEELYDYRRDPFEQADVLGRARGAARDLDRMRRRLEVLDSLYPRVPAPGSPGHM